VVAGRHDTHTHTRTHTRTHTHTHTHTHSMHAHTHAKKYACTHTSNSCLSCCHGLFTSVELLGLACELLFALAQSTHLNCVVVVQLALTDSDVRVTCEAANLWDALEVFHRGALVGLVDHTGQGCGGL